MDLGRCLGSHHDLLGEICAEGREAYLVGEPESSGGVDLSFWIFYLTGSTRYEDMYRIQMKEFQNTVVRGRKFQLLIFAET